MNVRDRFAIAIEEKRKEVAERMGTKKLSEVFLFVQVDMDKTLTIGTAWTPEQVENSIPNYEMIAAVNSLGRRDVIIIYTARHDELIPATIKWLRKHSVRYDAISNIKRAAHIMVDDKAFNPFTGCGCEDCLNLNWGKPSYP